ncbi:hypothetical protein [Ruminococcus sp.]|jgi:hypothetical protein|uniref:hypothetical protein n=1 Tax=Ruminococcus sp. TaxID=41978 RepID=UPI0025D99E77|nr:hypothetical protein [Ruminococcus sp.]
MKSCENCRHFTRCTARSRGVVCNCYEKYGYRKDKVIMAEDKVLVLHYAEPNNNQLRGLCKMINKVEIENFLRSEKLKSKDLCKGRIKMIYSEQGKDNLINKDTGEVFKGTIMFVGFDRQDIVNLTDKQMSAIRCMYRKVG